MNDATTGRRVLVTGAAGFIGAALLRRLLQRDDVAQVVAADLAAPAVRHPRLRAMACDLAQPGAAAALAGAGVDEVFHLASLVSGGAEADYELGMRINFDATRELIDAARRSGACPTFVFASSIAVYGGAGTGGGFDVDDATPPAPCLSYGTQKLMVEALLDDCSRRGFVDGRSLRLPTVMVRPEVNTALSGWASALLREPANGRDYDCPVGPHTVMACISVDKVVDALLHAAALPGEAIGASRTLLVEGLPASASRMLDALRRRAGSRPLGAVRFAPDVALQALMDRLPRSTASARSRALGLPRSRDIDEIVDDYLRSLP